MRAALGFSPVEQHRYATGWLNTHPDKAGIAERFRDRLKAKGYNGITYGNEFEKSTRGAAANTAAIAFRPHQIEVRHHEQPMLHEGATAGPVSRLSSPLPHGTRYWSPSSGIFAPTTGYDPLLFGPAVDHEGDVYPRLREQVRREILDKLQHALHDADRIAHGGGEVGLESLPDWIRVYLAGGAVSEWAGSRPNESARDLDVLIGLDYARLRQESQGPGFRDLSDIEMDGWLNAALRDHFNDEAWHPAFGGIWSLTGYVNPHAWDITVLRPYAAYDLTNDRWAVRPPHSPEHPVELGYDPGPQARALMAEIRAVLHLPEPYRSGQARAVWDRIHDERSRTFSREGEGYTGPGNTIEKWLAYHPWRPLDKLRQVVFDKAA
jgi:hypothetical protein